MAVIVVIIVIIVTVVTVVAMTSHSSNPTQLLLRTCCFYTTLFNIQWDGPSAILNQLLRMILSYGNTLFTAYQCKL